MSDQPLGTFIASAKCFTITQQFSFHNCVGFARRATPLFEQVLPKVQMTALDAADLRVCAEFLVPCTTCRKQLRRRWVWRSPYAVESRASGPPTLTTNVGPSATRRRRGTPQDPPQRYVYIWTMDQMQRVTKLFDELADSYDAVSVEFFQPIGAGLVAALSPEPGQRALDVGCGRGAVLYPLLAAVGPTGSVTGIDLSPRMVEMTALDAARSGVEVELLVGDAMAPDLPPGTYDLVASSLVLFFLPDPLSALRAWRELLSDGGRVGVSTFGTYDDRWADTVDAVLQARAPKGVQDARTTGRKGPFASDASMAELLGEAGFLDIQTVKTVVHPRFDDCEHWYEWSMSVGQRQFWQSIPADQLDDVKRDVFAAVEGCRDEHGRIGFDQNIRYTLGRR